ncbi:MAG: DNA gyrase inhibitor YacG [Holophaga sp.]|jgi:hypothetical protein
MPVRPCPICRKPVSWETTPTRPFCSERCRLKDLGAWSGEEYQVPERPEEEQGEGWSGPEPGSGG